MALVENFVNVPTQYGLMPSFTAHPDLPGRFPAIIFYMDAPGYREELCNMARRIASRGYYCILPDMYYRLGTIRFDVARRDDNMTVALLAAAKHLDNKMVADDTAGLLAYIDAQDAAAPGKVGCVGHCMSGRFVTTAAGLYPTRFAAVGSLYGVGIVTDEADSPHLLFDRVQAEFFYSFAEVDAHVPDKAIEDLKAALKQHNVRATVEVPSGTQHGYQFAQRPVYAPIQAEHAWERLFDLWERNLK
jgi:carboxymethylenebutenolidase